VPANTASARSLLPLAPFAHDWVGGDIHGLAAFAGTLYGYAPQFGDVVTALDKSVSQIVGDAGWRGRAASAFTQNWDQISAEIDAVGLVVVQAGSIADQLAQQLAGLENALEQAADVTAAHGVPIGSDGQPSSQASTPAQQEWLTAYNTFYQECMASAESARVQAASALQTLGTKITSARPGGSGGTSFSTKLGEATTIGDLIFDLMATKTTYANQVADKLDEAQETLDKAKQAEEAAQAAARGADGRFGKLPDGVKAAYHDASAELKATQTELDSARGGENALSKIFGYRLQDLPGLRGVDAGLEESDALDKALGEVLDLPVVDVVAGGLNTYLNAQADVQDGVPAGAAWPLETANTIVTFAIADLVADAVGGAVAALSIAGAPVLAVIAGAVAAGVVAYGVGDYLHNYIADFGAQWHKYGVLAVITDQSAALDSTWDDTKHLTDDVGHLADHAWDSVWNGFMSGGF
jgi:uncharacterized protein YukE